MSAWPALRGIAPAGRVVSELRRKTAEGYESAVRLHLIPISPEGLQIQQVKTHSDVKITLRSMHTRTSTPFAKLQ